MKMKRMWTVFLAVVVVAATPVLCRAAFDVGFVETTDLNVYQSTALQLPADGVLKYRNVYIAPNVNLTFTKNQNNTPVTLLASGNVVIDANGTLNVSGSNGTTFLNTGKGGPGGFDGGGGGGLTLPGSRGQGPGAGGGGAYGVNYPGGGGGGGHASSASNGGTGNGSYGGAGGAAYGNTNLFPMVGGSGGGGTGATASQTGYAGGGGGGSILIAASGTIDVKGLINARGGNGGLNGYLSGAGGGSGGSIYLVATTISGDGEINAIGGYGGYTESYVKSNGGNGSLGRIRLEAWNLLRTNQSNPNFSFKQYPVNVIPAVMPSLTIASVGGVAVPTLPKGDVRNPDVIIPAGATMPLTIIVSANNIPAGSTVTVKALSGVTNDVVSAAGILTGSNESSAAAVQLSFSTGYPSLLTVSTTYQATAFLGIPAFADGEKVAQVRVDSQVGGDSVVTYITESGKEIPAVM